jgi:hypothetical protein
LALRDLLAQGALLAMRAALSPELIDRLTKIIVMLSSPNEGDLVAAGRALQRQLASAHTDIYALVERLRAGEDKNQFATEANAAYAQGLRDGEARAYGSDGFHSVDESAEWREVALYVAREKNRLPSRTLQKSAEFIADMATRAKSPYSREPTSGSTSGCTICSSSSEEKSNDPRRAVGALFPRDVRGFSGIVARRCFSAWRAADEPKTSKRRPSCSIPLFFRHRSYRSHDTRCPC